MKYADSGLGSRMKAYEQAFYPVLPRRFPVIIRVDMRSGHSFTRGLDKPFSTKFSQAMQETAGILCLSIDGCKLAYSQSDEISLLVTNNDTIETEPWFGNELSKIVSISASMATLAFNKTLPTLLPTYQMRNPLFDSRVFICPETDVANLFLWRQRDATRNSISSLAQANFPHKDLQGLNSDQLQEKLWQEKSINWNDVPTKFKRGFCVVKSDDGWYTDEEIPIFSQDRAYIESRLPKE